MRSLKAPELRAETFRHKLRRDLNVAHTELRLRRWRRACLTACGLAVALGVALTVTVASPELPGLGLPADHVISVANDREFVEAYYAGQGSDVRVESVDAERLVAIREFTLSDGQRMVVLTESDEGQPSRSTVPLEETLPILASETIF